MASARMSPRQAESKGPQHVSSKDTVLVCKMADIRRSQTFRLKMRETTAKMPSGTTVGGGFTMDGSGGGVSEPAPANKQTHG